MGKIDILETLEIRENEISIRIGKGSKYWHKAKKKSILILLGISSFIFIIYILFSLFLHELLVANMFLAFRLTYINALLAINVLITTLSTYFYTKKTLVRETIKHLCFEIETNEDLKNVFKSDDLRIVIFLFVLSLLISTALLYFKAGTLVISFISFLTYLINHLIVFIISFITVMYLTVSSYSILQFLWGTIFDIYYGNNISVKIDKYFTTGKYVAKIANSIVEKEFYLKNSDNYPRLFAFTILIHRFIIRLYIVLKKGNKYEYLFLFQASMTDLKRFLTEIMKSIDVKLKRIIIGKTIKEEDLKLEEIVNS